MFTGIVEEVGKVLSVRRQGNASLISIGAGKVLAGLKTGDSISTNGVCLTVTTFTEKSFTCDVMPETMRRSNLSELAPGSGVNLERALQLSDRLGGHIVTGHIDGTGRISAIRKEDNAVLITVTAGKELLRYIVAKGSVALDGISLTVVRVDDRSFEVSLIPHTHAETTFSGKTAGSILNIECDIVGKYVEKLVNGGKQEITTDYLRENGF